MCSVTDLSLLASMQCEISLFEDLTFITCAPFLYINLMLSHTHKHIKPIALRALFTGGMASHDPCYPITQTAVYWIEISIACSFHVTQNLFWYFDNFREMLISAHDLLTLTTSTAFKNIAQEYCGSLMLTDSGQNWILHY